MPRRNQPRRANRSGPSVLGPPTDSVLGGNRVEVGPDGDAYTTRMIPGAKAVKTYRCPGCDHEVRPGVAHIVAWPSDDFGGADNRRHWHTGCWSGRNTRGLTRRWS
ncbi:ATP/GTP-binding protein [Rhodococcus sp. 05-2255-3B1]|uniref:ATP/GTP-binding protein n=1 Tax=unclassified Rhodococcus (in: high G+C Gram-positive bacteria) TaxID=192944 RepID=UPI000B9B156D|nr:ATP/GTP-binding protein [Rhodococcus sp. 05-2255-3C]OZE16069.1 ATP/GTP-binding protein [Rhodococcus sp. 05-2255-3B1]OZE19109.1 ATP/GTP-binding protein [Rhodococcus sp. 05-2255-2A2]